MIESLQTPFKMTQEEVLTSTALSLILIRLKNADTPEFVVKELCSKPQYGFTASASETPLNSRFVRITDIQQGSVDWNSVPFCECNDIDKYKLIQNDILIARTGGTVGKSFFVSNVPEKAVFASYLIRLSVNSGILPKYMYLCLQSQQYWHQVIDASRGSAIKNINAKMLQSLRFPLPAMPIQERIVEFVEAFQKRLNGSDVDLPELPPPLEEQRWTVARIKELTAKIEVAQKLRRQTAKKAEWLAGSYAKEMFDLDGKYQKNLIEKICDVRGGIQKSSARIPGANPRRYITVAHVQRNWIDINDPRYFEVSDEELERWRLMKGDVLVIEGNGSAEQIGRTALFRGEIEDCVHQNHVIRVRPDQNKIVPEYLNAYLNSPPGQAQMRERSRTTSGLFNLSVGRIKSIEVPVPP
ncbi:MAG TPA: restriction endonuclease subunit S, partial [Synergistaceae bacterium]|nr:restriction endonuclease subunit S [Synergistaceae bacterium]